VDSRKVDGEIAKLIAETAKINSESRWYPFLAVAGVFSAAFAVVKLVA
jgi:hypothetical protein